MFNYQTAITSHVEERIKHMQPGKHTRSLHVMWERLHPFMHTSFKCSYYASPGRMHADGQAAVVLLETCGKHTHAPQAWMRVQPEFCWGWGLAPLQAIKISGHNTQPSILQYTATIKFLCVSGTINESEKWDGHSAYTGYSKSTDSQLWRWEMQPRENKREPLSRQSIAPCSRAFFSLKRHKVAF